MIFSNEQKQEIKSRIDIVSFIGEYIELKRSGDTYWGKCCFHTDSNPSFSVSPKRGIWKCWSGHGCGSGDIFTFYMKKHKVDFQTAVLDIARKYDISIEISEELKAKYELKNKLYKINADALAFYKNAMRFNHKAKRYLESRRLSQAVIAQFNIGSNDMIQNHMSSELLKTYSEADLIEAGLIGKTEDGKIYEVFNNRLVIPIMDEMNRPVGFTARVLDDKTLPKYKNTRETLVFNKREILYGLNFAKDFIYKQKTVIIVEGQFDVIRAMSLGINNVVCISGKEMTTQQAHKLGNLANNFLLCFDSDEAGQEAVEKAYTVIKDNVKSPTIKVVSLY